MPSIYQIKPAFQNLLRPLVQRLFDNGTTANQITLIAGIGSILVGAVIAGFVHHPWIFALVPIWMIVRMALNAIDGMLAREFNQQSRLGAYLNELCDITADCALILPFALLPGVSLWLVLLVALLALFSEYSGVLGPMVGASRRYDGPTGVCPGGGGRWHRTGLDRRVLDQHGVRDHRDAAGLYLDQPGPPGPQGSTN